MYTLTLTSEERKAFDWVGYCYNNGDKMSDILNDCECLTTPEDFEWCEDVDVTFDVPEFLAWEINQLAQEDDYLWPCFGLALARKMNEFIGKII